MNHLTEEQLILHYYGEESDTLAAEQHLDDCEQCRAVYGSLQRVLNVVDALPVPDRGADYGRQVWQRLEPALPARRRWQWRMPAPWNWAALGTAFAGMLVVAFLAGRFYNQQPHRTVIHTASTDPQAHERILMVAVGDYLERSQLVLIELANASPRHSLDITAEQERAQDLVSESRLYRQTALNTGDTAVSDVLDDLDRVLLEIAHAPSQLSPAELERLREHLQAEGILFKIRVLGTNVRNAEEAPASQVRQRL